MHRLLSNQYANWYMINTVFKSITTIVLFLIINVNCYYILLYWIKHGDFSLSLTSNSMTVFEQLMTKKSLSYSHFVSIIHVHKRYAVPVL